MMAEVTGCLCPWQAWMASLAHLVPSPDSAITGICEVNQKMGVFSFLITY